MMKGKLLRPFTGTGAIFFPIGNFPHGTCEFSTNDCRMHCYIKSNSLFDWESNVPESEKRDIYTYVINTKSVSKICKRIVKELDGLQTNILHWFGSGDCRTKDFKKISTIICQIPSNIVQMGFTRNTKLWEKFPDIFALTVENIKSIKSKSGVFSIPDYQEQISIMYSPSHKVKGGYCGPMTCRDLVDTSLEHHINCQVCHKLKLGCFDRVQQ